jgi:flagellar motor component MotA
MGENMTNEQFAEGYKRIAERALRMSEKARREGILALEDEIDKEKIMRRDVFEVGIRLVMDGLDKEPIEKILTNLVSHETDNERRLLLTIEKEAVLAIQEGWSPRLLRLLLNSFVNIEVEEAMKHLEEVY